MKHREHLEVIAKELLQKEILFQSDLERLIGKRPFDKPTTYQQFTNGQGKYEKKQQENEQPGVDPTPTLEGEKPEEVTK
jgi:cell division protease FtsH